MVQHIVDSPLTFNKRANQFVRALGVSALCILGASPAHADFIKFAAKLMQAQGSDTRGASASASAQGFTNCSAFFPGARIPTPSSLQPGQQRELCFNSFAVLHSGQSKTPLYAVERLTSAQLIDAKGEARTDRFFADARLPNAERAQLEDYTGSGYDRGHMAPAADMPDATSMAQSFSLANMVPQDPQHNRKTWAGIEKATRHYVMRAPGTVYVFTGPIFASPPNSQATTGGNDVWVPSHLYKLVYDETSGRAWAHWTPNNASARATKPLTYAQFLAHGGPDLLAGSRIAP